MYDPGDGWVIYCAQEDLGDRAAHEHRVPEDSWLIGTSRIEGCQELLVSLPAHWGGTQKAQHMSLVWAQSCWRLVEAWSNVNKTI